MKVHISHCDLDGAIPLVVDKVLGINYDKVINENYGDLLELEDLKNATENDEFVYTDFSPEGECLDLIREKNLKVIVIDHHESVVSDMEDLKKDNPNFQYYFDVNKCGTSLYLEYAYDVLHTNRNNVLNRLCHLTEVYDLYRDTDVDWEMASDLNRLMFKIAKWYAKDNFQELHGTFLASMIWKCQNSSKFFFSKLEIEKINIDKKEEEELFKQIICPSNGLIKTRKDSDGHNFCLIKTSKKISAICRLLMLKYKKVDYVVVLNTYDEESPKISLRSRNLNLLQFKECKGHELACGVAFDDDKKLDMDYCNKLWSGEIYQFTKVEN